MKRKNLLYIPLILGIGFGFFSCNFGNGGNVTTYPFEPAIIDYNVYMGGTTIGTRWGTLAAPALTTVYPGDCVILSQFTVDFDNQPSADFYTATDVYVAEVVNQSYLEISDTVDIRDYTLPISIDNGLTSPYFYGMFFTSAFCNDKSPDFRLVCDTTGVSTDNKMNLYLLAQPSGTSASNAQTIHAFNVSQLVQDFGQDGTVYGSDSKHITVYLKYLTSISETGQPSFGTIQDPFDIHIFK
jgi:hypothetical protein